MRTNNITKALYLLLITVILPIKLIGQETEWYEFELENIRIEFPTEEVFQLDTIVTGIRLNQLYTTIDNATLIIQKLPAEKTLSDTHLSSLPYDYSSLIEYYDGVVDGAMEKSNAQNVEKKEINFGGLVGYNSIFYDEKGDSFIVSNTFLVENSLIMISCYNLGTDQNNIKTKFFNSLNFDNFESLKQYTGKSKAYRQGYAIGKLFFYAFLGIGLFFLVKTLRKKK